MTATNLEPFLFDKNLGAPMQVEPGDLPQTNADGRPIIPLTAEQKYLFDARGWLLIPGVLSDSEVAEMRDYALRVHNEPASLPERERAFVAGPLQQLTDHPVVVGFMHEFLANPTMSTPDCYGFRLEACTLAVRTTTESPGGFGPHNGNGFFRFAQDSHHYQCVPGRAFSGLTRVMWELNPVKYRQGGTMLATGSHKSAYTAPAAIRNPDFDVWDTYECPAGSVLFFTEALTHSTSPWTNEENGRICGFTLYNSLNSKWGTWEPPPGLVETMPPQRQTLFRGIHCGANVPGYRYWGENHGERRPAG